MPWNKTLNSLWGLGLHLPNVNPIGMASEVPIWVSSGVETAMMQQLDLHPGRGWSRNVVGSIGSRLRTWAPIPGLPLTSQSLNLFKTHFPTAKQGWSNEIIHVKNLEDEAQNKCFINIS